MCVCVCSLVVVASISLNFKRLYSCRWYSCGCMDRVFLLSFPENSRKNAFDLLSSVYIWIHLHFHACSINSVTRAMIASAVHLWVGGLNYQLERHSLTGVTCIIVAQVHASEREHRICVGCGHILATHPILFSLSLSGLSSNKYSSE